MKNRFLTTFICIFIAVVLVSGGTLALVTGVRSMRAVATVGNVTVDEGTVRYLAAYYKMLYLKELRDEGIDASDSQTFWALTAEDGRTYGDNFNESFDRYLASLMAAANIYLTYSVYTPNDKLRVATTTEDILQYKANGSVDEFNSNSEIYGFDFTDFQNAAALIFKARNAESVIYGEDAEDMENYPELCDEYFAGYSHVSLLFLNTSMDMTEEERAEKQQTIDLLTAAITANNNGEDIGFTPDTFYHYLEDSDGDPVRYESGYYFHPDAEGTAEFAESLPEVVSASLEMEIGEFRRVDYSAGVCFIYKYDLEEEAYTDESDPLFSDFFYNASVYHYERILSEIISKVKFKDSYREIDPVSVPLINDYYIREFK